MLDFTGHGAELSCVRTIISFLGQRLDSAKRFVPGSRFLCRPVVAALAPNRQKRSIRPIAMSGEKAISRIGIRKNAQCVLTTRLVELE